MSFTINTNTYGLYAHARTSQINDRLGGSLEKLSSGLRINSAADDASGLAISNNLKMQASSLNQGIKNANEAIGLATIADNAMDELASILDTIKSKSIQSAQDGQSAETRDMLQKDIAALMDSYSQIVNYTEYNGKKLLSGTFMNKEFQVGAGSHQTVDMNITNVGTDGIGHTRFETYNLDNAAAVAYVDQTMTFVGAGLAGTDFTMAAVTMGSAEGEGVGALATEINKYTETTGIKASWTNRVAVSGTSIGAQAAAAPVTINGVALGSLTWLANDSDGSLTSAINAVSSETGVIASVNERGELVLDSVDGRAIEFTGLNAANGLADTAAGSGFVGTLTLVDKMGRDIDLTGSAGNFAIAADAEATLNLAQVLNGFNEAEANAAGVSDAIAGYALDVDRGIGIGAETVYGAAVTMDIAENALRALDAARSDIGSVTNQLTSQISNATVAAANIKIAESGIRDVDFAMESAEFNKNKLLAQAGTFALSQASSIEQNVMKLLQ